jgi:hypothetical protein
LRGHIDAALADAEKRGAEMREAARRMEQAVADYVSRFTDNELTPAVMAAHRALAAALAQPVAGADAGGAK